MSNKNNKTELEKMLSGQVYDGADQEIDTMRANARKSLMVATTTKTQTSNTYCKSSYLVRLVVAA